jgi:hypothetical protein
MNIFHSAEKIRNAYDPEHDVDPSKDAPPVTWREMLLLDMIEDLQSQINAMRSVDESDGASISETIRSNADAAAYTPKRQ